MRKFYSLFAFFAMLMVSVAANAQATLPSENAILQGEGYNMRLFKTWDFMARTVNGAQITPDALTFGAQDDSMPVCDGYKPTHITNEGMTDWCMGIGNIELADGKGLYNNKNGIRYVMLTGLKQGQIVCIENSAAKEKLAERIYSDEETYEDVQIHDYAVNACRIQKASLDGKMPAWTVSYFANNGGTNVVEEITDAVHAEQAKLDEGKGEEDASAVDAYRYFKVVEDGPLYIAMGKYCALKAVQIWIDGSAEESVSVPSYKMVSVNGGARDIVFTPGESTFGETCHVSYGIVDEGGTYEDFEYDAAGGSVTLYASSDADGDGFITIEAVTVSASGKTSEPVQFQLAIGEIALSNPELSLVGIEGLERTYSIAWNNNTLCGEDYAIVVEGDNGDVYREFDPNTGIGEQIAVKNNIKVTVKVNGYTSGVTEQEALRPGTEFKRKNAATDEEGNVRHDYDFVNLSKHQKAILLQDYQLDNSILEKCYVVNGTDTVYYSAAEFIEGVAADGTDITAATPVLTHSGWYDFDSSRGRTSRIVVTGGGEDQNADGNGYEKDALGLWDGISISNPPYTNSANTVVSSILLYNNGDLGLYLGTKPVITFPRDYAVAGEYVLLYIGYGGSNYTNTRYPVIYEVPQGELLSVTLGNNPHLFYIDVYTHDNLEADAIKSVDDNQGVQEIVGYYGANGARFSAPQKGINIVKYADGTSMKVLVK